MDIAVVGLGLIGASFAKGIKQHTNNKVYGFDINNETLTKAKRDGTIDDIVLMNNLSDFDMVIVALYPVNTIEVCTDALKTMKKGSTLVDLCGIKGSIVDKIEPLALKAEVDYIGTHPMAGRELWGYDAAVNDLFKGASFIITKTENTNMEKVEMLKSLAEEMLFKESVITTPKEHDKIIAFTSQLAHVVSNAYVKSPSLLEEKGFSAGSFLDLTRVAKLNEYMWSELFVMNKEPLLFEVDNIIKELEKYREALENDDIHYMEELLKEGRILKEKSNLAHSKKC